MRNILYTRFRARKPDETSRLWSVYPPGATNAPGSNLLLGLDSPVHWISSERLFWLDERTLAFTDHYPGENRLVIAELRDAQGPPVVHTQALSPGDLFDPDRCRKRYALDNPKNISQDPSALLRVTEIARIPEKPGYLCPIRIHA